MGKPGQLNAPSHVHRVDCRSCQLVHASVTSRDHSRGDQRHSSADHVYGYHVEAFPLVRWQLPEIRAQQIRERPGSIDTLIPSRERRALRAFHNRRPYNRDGKIVPPACEHRFAKTFCERVGIGPAQVLRPAHSHAHQPVSNPARPIAFQHSVEFRHRRRRFIAAASERLTPKGLRKLGAFGARLDMTNHLAQEIRSRAPHRNWHPAPDCNCPEALR